SVGTMGEQVREFKEMVSALHEAGIEVILDVVYNHTGEGGHEGPTLAFRGIDHGGYYRLTEDLHNDYDVTGCGNSVDSSEPGVLNLIIDSMRYWVIEMGVDGFRFDLVSTVIRDEQHHVDQQHAFKQRIAADEVLSQVKLIAEPWDMGPFGYQVGSFGTGWSEWNDRFRGFTRDFWRGAVDGVQELAARLSGSADVFGHDGRPPSAAVNFVTAHDGFTLRDLVTYNHKHNEANGEDNRDGSDDNRSWNCGVEGETEDEGVLALRHRQVKNMLATVLLSAGVPMITAGDEIGRTQDGNNNAYCQDTPLSWVQWDTAEEWGDVTELTSTLLRLRAEYPVLRAEHYRHGDEVGDPHDDVAGRKDLAWFNGHRGEMTEQDWADPARRLLGMYVADETDAFLCWFHSGELPTDVLLPGGDWGSRFEVVAHTGFDGEVADEAPGDGLINIPGHSVVVLRAHTD
ncbi:MAG: glycogen debranching protein, partial [Propionibacteriaceae bacterium]